MSRAFRSAVWTSFVILLLGSLAVGALGQNDLVGVLKKKYVVAQTTLNRSQITVPGTVMDIQANGVNAEPWDTLIAFNNPVVDGNVQQPGTSVFGRGMALMRSRDANLMILKPGDKVYITKIEGSTGGKNDTLKLSVLSCDPLDADGGAAQKRYAATISFRLPKGGLMQTSPDDAERMVEAILAPDAGGDAGGAVAGGGPAASAGPAPPAAAAPPPPPPPPPAATQTIAMGQTISQVVSIMGQPLQIIDLGAKKTYKYKDLKVIFLNGKVSDVQ